MKIHAFDKDLGNTKVYAFEVAKVEIQKVSWTSGDQKFFEACSRGSVSRQLLGLSILAKRVEDSADQQPLKWKPTLFSDPDGSGRS